MYPKKDERNQKIIEEVKSGKSIISIAEEYGLSRQAVNAIKNKYMLHEDNPHQEMNKRALRNVHSVVYPEIKNFLLDHSMTVTDLCIKVEEPATTSGRFYRFLRGETSKISLNATQKLLQLMGMSFEQVFRKN